MKYFLVTQRIVVNTTIFIKGEDEKDAEEAAATYVERQILDGFDDGSGEPEDQIVVSEIETTGCDESTKV